MSRAQLTGSRTGTYVRSPMPTTVIHDLPSPLDDAIQVGTDTGELATGLVNEVADSVITSLTDNMTDYEKKVLSDWPVRTGFSKSKFYQAVDYKLNIVLVSLKNSAAYSGLIKQHGYLPENAATRIVFDHTPALAEKMATDIADNLV